MRVLTSALVGGLIASAAFAGSVAAVEPHFSRDPFDPPRIYVTPPAGALTYTDPSPDGIPYRWWVNLGVKGKVTFGYYVGAKSWWEPLNPPATPGWTHNSNWVALNLTKAAYVTIQVGPDVPVPCAPPSQPAACDATGRTGSDIYPAISIYNGQDTTSEQDHTFNPVGDGWWATVDYRTSTFRSNPHTHVLSFTRWLPAGQYTINIGGAGAKSPNCDASKPCFVGGKSYQASISTSPTLDAAQ